MDGQNGGNDDSGSNGGNTSSAASTRGSRAELLERMRNSSQQLTKNLPHYAPLVHEQFSRLFPDYDPPWYAKLRGFSRERVLSVVEHQHAAACAVGDRMFSDADTIALTDHALSSLHRTIAWRWTLFGLAGYMTWRGRGTFRFPFFRPILVRTGTSGGGAGGQKPFSSFTNPSKASPGVKAAYHFARFAAYYGVNWIFLEPAVQAVNFMVEKKSMMEDPRLVHFHREQQQRDAGAGGDNGSTDGGGGERLQWPDDPQTQYRQSDMNMSSSQSHSKASSSSSSWGSDDASPTSSSTSSSWSPLRWNSSRKTPPSNDTSADSSSNWDSVSEVIDDASPISASSRNSDSRGGSSRGSSWDRIRQQSQPTQQSSSSSAWTRAAQQSASSGSDWSRDGGTSPEYRGPRESFSFGKADSDRNGTKDTAQKEFDALLDRERRGFGDESRSWGK